MVGMHGRILRSYLTFDTIVVAYQLNMHAPFIAHWDAGNCTAYCLAPANCYTCAPEFLCAGMSQGLQSAANGTSD